MNKKYFFSTLIFSAAGILSYSAFQNTGGLTIKNNRIDGNLQCKENRPAPTGGGNIVQGNKEDQCSRL
ncbi:MAG: hypothetical protein KME59_13680 [Trichormus sp. ATA11-4-KO1]|nr:hypothetical protein [Trichormus sp. ATA11-4-KO1]